ncbi:MAG: stage II sporulation protein D, partial [Oscillospiraceae bacterium]|nr:stage II sporulation protein D [Oscillospiraceae bacterium]
LGALTATPSGTVTEVDIGGTAFTGFQLRAALGLRSACFTITRDGGTLTFTVDGYGHDVGMSQYGANYLAGQGLSYREILQYYYTGVDVE